MGEIFLLAGLMLPWLLGIAALAATRDTKRAADSPGEIAWIVGAGYLTGAFMLTLWMRALSLAGLAFDRVVIAAPLLLVTAALGWIAWRRHRDTAPAAIRGALRGLLAPPHATRAIRIAWQLLLAWIALRYVLLALEVVWQPLYPWDAWIQWATKARVWYEQGRIVPFARSEAWFAAGGAVWFDASPEYPPTMPLLQVWSCVALGRWDDSLMNAAWWQFSLALTTAVYGALRSQEIDALPALVGAFLVASLPLANVHVALAGYADLPMAVYYTGAALAFLRWTQSRSPRDAGLAVFLAVACTQIKVPGLIWALTLLPGVVVALLPRQGPKVVAIGLAVVLFALAVLAQTHPVVFNYRLHLDFDPAWRAVGETQFLLGNWHFSGTPRRRRAARVATARGAFPRYLHRGRRRRRAVPGHRLQLHQCAAMGHRADDDQPRDAARRTARRCFRCTRVPRVRRALGGVPRRPRLSIQPDMTKIRTEPPPAS